MIIKANTGRSKGNKKSIESETEGSLTIYGSLREANDATFALAEVTHPSRTRTILSSSKIWRMSRRDIGWGTYGFVSDASWIWSVSLLFWRQIWPVLRMIEKTAWSLRCWWRMINLKQSHSSVSAFHGRSSFKCGSALWALSTGWT